MSYATASEVKAYSALSVIAALSDDDLNNKYIPRAERIINSYTRQNFNRSAQKINLVDGSGGNRLEMPERLLSLAQLSFIDGGGHAAGASGLVTDNFLIANHFLISDDSKIEITGGQANLINGTTLAVTKTYPFTMPSNYTFDAAKIEVTTGLARLLLLFNLHGHWKLNESSGVVASDSSGNGRNGTLINMEDGDWIAAKLNNGLNFGGVDESVEMTDTDGDFERTDKFSVDLWFKANALVGSGALVTKWGKDGDDIIGWGIFLTSSGEITVAFENSSSNRIFVQTTASGFDDDTFHHLALTFDGSSTAAGIKIYVDGVLQAVSITSDTLSLTMKNSFKLRFGARDISAGALSLVGVIDEVAIYEDELTLAQVVQRFNSGTGSETIFKFSNDNPIIETNDGLVFSDVLTILTMVATEVGSDSVTLILSKDAGATYEYWDGGDWVASDDSLAQSNDIATALANLAAFASSGTIKIKFVLHTDGGTTPSVDTLTVANEDIYPTDDDLYFESTDEGKINPSGFLKWISFLHTTLLSAEVDARILFSLDGRLNWLTWNGANWVAPGPSTARANATTLADATANFLKLNAIVPLNYRIFLFTTDPTKTPVISQLAFTSLSVSSNATINAVDVNAVFNKRWYLMLDSDPIRPRQRIGRQEGFEDTLIFPLGFNNIKVDGFWGYSSVPFEVRDATSEVVERIVVNEGSKLVRHGQLLKEKIGDYSYEKPKAADVGTRDSYISNLAKDFLREFRKPILIGKI